MLRRVVDGEERTCVSALVHYNIDIIITASVQGRLGEEEEEVS